jgi:hypothetical protein
VANFYICGTLFGSISPRGASQSEFVGCDSHRRRSLQIHIGTQEPNCEESEKSVSNRQINTKATCLHARIALCLSGDLGKQIPEQDEMPGNEFVVARSADQPPHPTTSQRVRNMDHSTIRWNGVIMNSIIRFCDFQKLKSQIGVHTGEVYHENPQKFTQGLKSRSSESSFSQSDDYSTQRPLEGLRQPVSIYYFPRGRNRATAKIASVFCYEISMICCGIKIGTPIPCLFG